ncbi:MAG: phenylalanine--tRNA ligase subunit beta [Balneolales bacterium]
MKISYNWLSQYLSEIPDPQKTAERLTLTGLEVEEMQQTGSAFRGIVVGEVLEVHPHPDADRLVVCKVDTGDGTHSQIVCGAPNVATGQKVVVATVGSVLPVTLPDGSPFKIRKAKIRGQHSEGMICAKDELGLGDDHSGIMVLDHALAPGTPFSSIAGSVPDTVFEIGLTPNRPDAACHLGVARDLAAVTGAKLKKPFDNLPKITKGLGKNTIRIVDTDKCFRYAGVVVRGVTIDESPQWLKNRLTAIGLRPINNVVDITNFVLQELGQPLHAFDYHRLADGRIEVKSFDTPIRFNTLDNVERDIPSGSLFICDGEKPVALAGVMGGQNSEISKETTDLLIESAWFEPTGIRKTSRALSLQTDSSYRFERGVDTAMTDTAALRCAELILDLCGGNIEGMEDCYPVNIKPDNISLRGSRLGHLLGTNIEEKTVEQILGRLEIPAVTEKTPGKDIVWHCTVPTFRPDITEEIDLIEEIARIYDYNNIPDPEQINISSPEPVPYHEQFIEQVRRAATAAGLREIYTNSLLPERLLDFLGGKSTVVSTLNPITKDQALLRTGLLFGFLRSASYNFNRDATGVRFFEIGNIFKKTENKGTWIGGIHEATHLHIGIAGNTHSDHWKSTGRPFDLFDLKSILSNILQQLNLNRQVTWRPSGGKLMLVINTNNEESIIGSLSVVNSEWKKQTEMDTNAFSAELDLTKLQAFSKKMQTRRYRPVSRYPSFEFDLALVVDKKVPAGDLEKSMYTIAGEPLQSIEVFDVFEGGALEKHQKSIAFRLTFQDNDKTLTIDEIDPIIQQILKKLRSEFNAALRS